MRNTLFHFLFCCLFIPSLLFSQEDSVETGLKTILKEYNSVGIAVAVVRDNQLIYANAVGYSNLEKSAFLKSTTLLRIASISKSFTASAIMKLIDAGKIHLDDDVSNIIGFPVRNPKFPNVPITIRLLMSHLSSLNDNEGYYSLDVMDSSVNLSWGKAYANFSPGDNFLYSNLNYNLLGAIIEKVSGQRFDQFVIEQILEPIGIKAGYDVSQLDISRIANIYTYNPKNGRYSKSFDPSESKPIVKSSYVIGRSAPLLSPTGGLKISAVDLSKYMMMHMNFGKFAGKQILSDSLSRAMQTQASVHRTYGLGLKMSDKLIPGENLIGHTGSAYGLYSAMYFHPDKKFGIVVITNGTRVSFSEGFNSVIWKTFNYLYQQYIVQ